MITSELIQPHHLQRQSIVYIRQSSPQQVFNHQESLRLQMRAGRARLCIRLGCFPTSRSTIPTWE